MMFENPCDCNLENVRKKHSGKFTILYLLRRDIETCYKCNALWLGVMGIFAGIDLLAKYFEGNDDNKKSSERFKKFLEKYFAISNEDNKKTIYQLRNSLMHSFGLYSKDNQGYEYFFQLGRASISLVSKDINTYKVNVDILKNLFERAISNYHTELINDNNLQDNFNKMFSKYGAINIFSS